MPLETEAARQREELRNRFRPGRLRWLFVGESPPASGRFFYRGDSGLNRAMRDAFRAAGHSIDDENFLSVFQSLACYPIDLCQEPADRLDSRPRRLACRGAEAAIAAAIAGHQPATIGTLLRSIEGNVGRATVMAGWHGSFLHLPYSGRWSRHRSVFLEAAAPAIARMMQEAAG